MTRLAPVVAMPTQARPRDGGATLMLAVVALVSLVWLMLSQTWVSVPSPVSSSHDGGAAWRVWLLLALAPCVEEIILRLGIQEPLTQRCRETPWVPNVVTAALFALAHAAVRQEPWALTLILPGLLLGAVYRRGHGLMACIALHAGMNACWLAGTNAWLRGWSGA